MDKKEHFFSFLPCKDPITPPNLPKKLRKDKIKGKKQPPNRWNPPKATGGIWRRAPPKPPYSDEGSRNRHSLICFKRLDIFMFIVIFGF
jgi:hypothetical protein